MHLTWAICHDDGREKGWLIERKDGRVRGGVGKTREATLTASLEEGVADLIHPGRSRLKVHCHPVVDDPGHFLLFNGLIQQPRALGRVVEISAVDPSNRLLSASPAPLPPAGDAPVTLWDPYEGEQSAVMWELIDRCDRRTRELRALAPTPDRKPPLMGIVAGDLADTGHTRSIRFADVKTGWDSLVALSKRNHAPDFDFRPLDRDDGVFAAFDTYYPRQGVNRRDDVILEYGTNLSDFAYEPSGVDLCNRYALVGKARTSGGAAPVYVAENLPSIRRHGLYQRIESAADVGDVGELQRRAEEFVAKHAFTVNFVDVAPVSQIGGLAVGFKRDAKGAYAPGDTDREWMIPPSFGPPGTGLGFDYWQGDTITVRAKDQLNLYVDKVQPGPATDMYARVTDWEFAEVDRDANVVVTHSLSPVIPAANVTGYESRISTKAGGA